LGSMACLFFPSRGRYLTREVADCLPYAEVIFGGIWKDAIALRRPEEIFQALTKHRQLNPESIREFEAGNIPRCKDTYCILRATTLIAVLLSAPADSCPIRYSVVQMAAKVLTISS
jgi:hypothetical protein